jgi:hypothetical protein
VVRDSSGAVLPGVTVEAASPALIEKVRVVVTDADIAPSLGRDLAEGDDGSVELDLIPPNTVFLDRRNQTDIRISRNFQLGRVRLQGNLDLYNLFNANYATDHNETFGPEWLRPQTILLARLVKLGVNLSF